MESRAPGVGNVGVVVLLLARFLELRHDVAKNFGKGMLPQLRKHSIDIHKLQCLNQRCDAGNGSILLMDKILHYPL